MKQKLLLALFALWIPWSAWADVEIDGIYYNLVAKAKVAEVTNGGTMGRYSGDIVIPETVIYEGVTYSVTTINSYAFCSCSSLTSVTIGNSVTSIGSESFADCSSLTSVTIGNSVTSIGSYAFDYCTSLISIIIGNSVTSIGEFAFSSCTNLTSIEIPNSVTYIGNSAFYRCSALETLTIGGGVANINNYSFALCKNLTTVKCLAENVPSTSSTTFDQSLVDYATLYVLEGSLNNYKSTEPWSGFGTIKAINEEDPNGIWTSSDLAEGNYLFQNVATSLYLGPANSWGTQASLIEASHYNTLAKIDKGLYTIESQVGWGDSNKYFDGTFMDQRPVIVRIRDNGNGVYTMSTNENYYGYDGSSTVLANSLTDYSNVNAQWRIIPCNRALVGASNENPVDATFMILDANFDRNNRNMSQIADNNWQGAWTINSTHQNIAGENSNFCMESWRASFTLSQTINVPNGKYQVTAQAALTDYAGYTTDTNWPVVYANDASLPFNLMTNGENSMNSISNQFTAGKYVVGPIEVVVTNNVLTIGAKGTRRNLWAVWDNFRLYYYGEQSGDRPLQIEGIYYVLDDNDKTATIVSGDEAYTGAVTIPATVTKDGKTFTVIAIGEGAFQNASGLTAINIPSSITTIDSNAFNGCNNLTSVTVAWETPVFINSTVFSNCGNATLYVPMGTEATYSTADYWKVFREIVGLNKDNGQVSINNIYYTYDNDGKKATVTGAAENLKVVVIPSEVTLYGTTYTVTVIAREAFKDHGMTSVTIPYTITEIGYDAFRSCKDLVSMEVEDYYSHHTQLAPPSVEGLVDVDGTMDPACNPAFSNLRIYDDNFNAVYDSRNGCNAFIRKETNTLVAGCQRTVIPDGVEKIHDHAFYGQANLTAIKIPASVKTIGSGAFYGCSNLELVTLNEGLEKVENYVFYNCEKLSSITIPTTVTSIGQNAFMGCENLKKVTMPDIAAWCAIIFANREATPLYYAHHLYSTDGEELTHLEIPDGVTAVSDFAFYYATNITEVTIPASVDSIGKYAFCRCSSITAIDIPQGVEAIGDFAFYYCTNLASLVIPTTVSTIGEYAFYYCNKLTTLEIPEGVITIGRSAFSKCTGLSEVTLPATLAVLGINAFAGCDNLTAITALMATPPILTEQITDIEHITLYVPHGTKALYEAADIWKEFYQIIELEGEEPEKPIEVTDISEFDNAIYIEPLEARKGQTVALNIQMKNTLSPVGCSFKLTLPEGFSLLKDEDGDVVYGLGSRAKKMSVVYQASDERTFDFALTPSSGTASITGTEGTLITLQLEVPEKISEGDYEILLTKNLIQSKDNSNTTVDNALTDIVSAITIFDYLLGDVNDDGNVTPADAIMILYHYFGVEQAGFIAMAADVNGDGNISPADAIEVLYMYFNAGQANAPYNNQSLDPQ